VSSLQKAFEAREQRSEGELLSTAAKRPMEKQVTAGEQRSEGELLDPNQRVRPAVDVNDERSTGNQHVGERDYRHQE
jgi:hypothetical protein